jgi:tRNA(Ile)-lysidine synthase
VLKSSPYRLVIGHVDHRLRRGSPADARFVRALAKAWDIPCVIAPVPVRPFARQKKIGLEEAARELRYRALVRIARERRCVAIVTAHTAGDQAETVLMNFLRGTGPAGLAAIPEVRPAGLSGKVTLIRPFLRVTRAQIERYLKRHSLHWRIDPSNRSLDFSRNRIRHVTLPYLEKGHPGLAGRLLQSAAIFRTEEAFWHDAMARELPKTVRTGGREITVVLHRLLRYHKAFSRRILRRALPGLTFQDIEQLLTLARSPRPTAWLKLSGPWQVRFGQKKLVAIRKRTE